MPEWNQWATQYKQYCDEGRPLLSEEDFYYIAVSKVKKLYHSSGVVPEYMWIENKRPYYSVYPVATEALLKVKLDIPATSVKLPLGQIHIRFPVNAGPKVSEEYRLKSVFAVSGEDCSAHFESRDHTFKFGAKGKRGFAIWVDYGLKKQFPFFSFLIKDGSEETVEHVITSALAEQDASDDPEVKRALAVDISRGNSSRNALIMGCRLVCGISLLAKDANLIIRDVLSKDDEKYKHANEEERRIIEERAVRRGKVGYVVGESWEVIPHRRRPHLGFRKMRTGWELRPIKAAIVKRKKLTEVPTGFEDAK